MKLLKHCNVKFIWMQTQKYPFFLSLSHFYLLPVLSFVIRIVVCCTACDVFSGHGILNKFYINGFFTFIFFFFIWIFVYIQTLAKPKDERWKRWSHIPFYKFNGIFVLANCIENSKIRFETVTTPPHHTHTHCCIEPFKYFHYFFFILHLK